MKHILIGILSGDPHVLMVIMIFQAVFMQGLLDRHIFYLLTFYLSDGPLDGWGSAVYLEGGSADCP